MKIETKYNFNDIVYPIIQGSKEIVHECNICHGKGCVKIENITFSCPECYGTGGKREYKNSEWYVLTKQLGKIGKIDIDLYNNKRYGESRITYMLDSTGIGSGSVWEEDNLYKTFEEAQQECDKRNKENNAE